MRINLAGTLACLLGLVSVGCFSAASIAALGGPSNYAMSPNLATKPLWRAAVLPPSAGPSSDAAPAAGLYDYAGMALMRTGRFTVVDRSLVDKLLGEQEFSYSGTVDAATASRLGKMLGAEAVVTVSITALKHDEFWSDSPEQRDAAVHVKVISVETTEVLYSATGEGSDFEGAAGALQMALEVALAPLKKGR